MRYALIMAGGAGTRLWPLSRSARPKQLIGFIPPESGEGPARSLLELAASRLDGLVDESHRFICTAERYRDQIRDRVPGFTDERILGEPAARDTVNAVGFGAAVFERLDPDAVFCVLTSDHIIRPDDRFRERMETGFRLVEEDPSRLVTFSVKPTYPATGFGYVQHGPPIADGNEKYDGRAFRVAQFVEKPDLPRAQAYVESGDFGWNAGMFVFKASTFLECLRKFKPESHDGLRQIQAAWTTPDRQGVLDRVYPELPKISVDYAVMEPAGKDESLSICGVEMDVDWLDVGSWPSYAETLPADSDGNRSGGDAKAVTVDSRGNLVVSEGTGDHTVALLGCEDLCVVHTKDATLVMPLAQAEKLKALHGKLPSELT
ncbi:MAG: mannose-1-phosphate guanylyltransferase [Planctomycetota bacterium]